jgi:hypothetical protein
LAHGAFALQGAKKVKSKVELYIIFQSLLFMLKSIGSFPLMFHQAASSITAACHENAPF